MNVKNLPEGNLKIGAIDKFEEGKIYEGGSIKVFENYTGAKVLAPRLCLKVQGKSSVVYRRSYLCGYYQIKKDPRLEEPSHYP